VNVIVALVLLLVVTAGAVAAMLLVRRRAPAGSYFSDGDRASGVFGALSTGLSLLLGFLIFLAFSSYDASRQGAETEAVLILQQAQTAQFMASDVSTELTGELVCYGRTVATTEWESLNAGKLGDRINPWGAALFETMIDVVPETAPEQSAYDRWMDQTSVREQARLARVHGVEGVMPTPLWVCLVLLSMVVFGFMLLFADPAEGAVTQGALMGCVTVVMGSLMLLLVFFDHPHGEGIGRLQPIAMERTLRLLDTELEVVGIQVSAPCDARGNVV
jgi:amino acid transporter